MGLSSDILTPDSKELVYSLDGHWDLHDLLLACDPPLVRAEYSDFWIDGDVIAELIAQLRDAMQDLEIPETAIPHKLCDDPYDWCPDLPAWPDHVPYYLRLALQLSDIIDTKGPLICSWSA